jgi:hypothetical protein
MRVIMMVGRAEMALETQKIGAEIRQENPFQRGACPTPGDTRRRRQIGLNQLSE